MPAKADALIPRLDRALNELREARVLLDDGEESNAATDGYQTGPLLERADISVNEVINLAATLKAASGVLSVLAGGQDHPAIGHFDWVLEEVDRVLAISWEEDAHLTNPLFVEMQARSDEVEAKMLRAIVDDPYDALLQNTPTRRRLHEQANELEEYALRARAKAEGALP
jgi:hypothetical protein